MIKTCFGSKAASAVPDTNTVTNIYTNTKANKNTDTNTGTNTDTNTDTSTDKNTDIQIQIQGDKDRRWGECSAGQYISLLQLPR